MPKLVKYVPVRRGLDTVWLSPGDELPEWAAGLVGDHALEDEAPEPAPLPEEDAPAAKSKSSEVPDFTAPAARRSRPRK